MKPQRLVMSVAPNKSYLEGYNSALDATEDHHKKLEDGLRKLLDAYQYMMGMDEEAAVRKEAQDLLDDCATDYDVDMDLEKDAQ